MLACFFGVFWLDRLTSGRQVDVPKNVLSLWDRDESLCLRAGRYQSQLVAYGSARRWGYPELHVLKDVLVKHGWWASTVQSVRGLGKRGYRKVKATDWRYFYRVGEPRKNRNHKKKKDTGESSCNHGDSSSANDTNSSWVAPSGA